MPLHDGFGPRLWGKQAVPSWGRAESDVGNPRICPVGGRETRWGGVEVEGIGELKEARRWIGMYKICVGIQRRQSRDKPGPVGWQGRVFIFSPPGFSYLCGRRLLACWTTGSLVKSLALDRANNAGWHSSWWAETFSRRKMRTTQFEDRGSRVERR